MENEGCNLRETILSQIYYGLVNGLHPVNSDGTAWRYYDIRIDHHIYIEYEFRGEDLYVVVRVTGGVDYTSCFNITRLEFIISKDVWKVFRIKLTQAIDGVVLEYLKDNMLVLNSIY